MQCSIGALYIIIFFLNPQLYKIQVLYNCGKETTATAAEKRPPLSAISPLRPFLCVVLSRPWHCPTHDGTQLSMSYCKTTKNYLLYLLSVYIYLISIYSI